MKPAHYCTNPACRLCRRDDEILRQFLEGLGVSIHFSREGMHHLREQREDIASGNVWPEEEGEES